MNKIILVFVILISTTGCCKYTDPNCMKEQKQAFNTYCKNNGYEKGVVIKRSEIYCVKNNIKDLAIGFNIMTGRPYDNAEPMKKKQTEADIIAKYQSDIDDHCRANNFEGGFVDVSLTAVVFWCVKLDKSMVRTAYLPATN
jgi:hypothetical protein